MDLIDLENIKQYRERVFEIFDNIRSISHSLNFFQNENDLDKWQSIKNDYYEELRELMMIENIMLNSLEGDK